jgi:uncharacterized protein
MIISIDGDKDTHDSNRPHALPPIASSKGVKAKGSYDKIMDTLHLIREVAPELSKRITLRGTFPWKNRRKRLIEDTLHLNGLVDQGLANHCSIEPAILTEKGCSVGPEGGVAFEESNVYDLYEEYLEVADWMVQRYTEGKPARFHQIGMFVQRLFHGIHAWTECGAGTGYVSMDAQGAVYACHRQQHSFIGSVQSGVDPALQAKWKDNRTVARPHCRACSLQYVCGGGCREESIGYHVSHHGMSPDEAIFQNYRVMCNFKDCWFAAALWVLSEVPRGALKSIISNPQKRRLDALHAEHARRNGFQIAGPTNRIPAAAVKTCADCDC